MTQEALYGYVIKGRNHEVGALCSKSRDLSRTILVSRFPGRIEQYGDNLTSQARHMIVDLKPLVESGLISRDSLRSID